MGYTDIDYQHYQPPYWIANKPDLKHCKFCNAVYNIRTKFIKVIDMSVGTENPRYQKVGDCKPNICPCCER